MTFDDEWVDEVKSDFKVCVVCCWFLIYCASLRLVTCSGQLTDGRAAPPQGSRMATSGTTT